MKQTKVGNIYKPSQEKLDRYKAEDIKRIKDEMNDIEIESIMGKLEHRKLEYELDCVINGTKPEKYEHYIDEYGFKGYHTDKLTVYGNVEETQRTIQRSGLEPVLNKYKFENFNTNKPHQKLMKDKATKFARSPLGAFIISGQSGVGKSHISTAISSYLMLRGNEVKYMKWVDEIEDIKSSENYHERRDKIHAVSRAEILYIDDFLKADLRKEPTASDIEIAFEIIDYRDYRELPTIISTEMTYEQIKVWNTALAGRLLEMSKRGNGDNFITVAYEEDRNYREAM